MNQTLPETIADILSHNGAIVDRRADGLLDVIVPDRISKTLNIPEYARLSFSYVDTYDEDIYASYDSNFFKSIRNLFREGGRFAFASYGPYMPNVDKLSRVLNEKIVFGNATFRLSKVDNTTLSYLLMFFKYIALSDEKQEGLFPLLINELNLSSIPFEPYISELMANLEEPDSSQQFLISPPATPADREGQRGIAVLQSAHTSAIHLLMERMKDFIKSLERRLNRDIKRVYEYYETLKGETKDMIEKRANSSSDGTEKLMSKLEAIEAERGWKIQDLIAKYAMSIKVEPCAIIRIGTRVPVFWIDIKRRLSSRHFPATYNPVIRQLDPLPCESCFNPHGGYYLCDDKLHIICGYCFKGCPSCGKHYCRVCHKDKCPKCKSGKGMR